jgi:chromosome segregation ATPase
MSDDLTPQTPPPSEMELLRAEMRAGFQAVAKRFDQVDTRLDGIDTHLGEHDKQFVSLETHLGEHDKRFVSLETHLGEHDKQFVSLDTHLGEHDKQFVSLDTHLGEHDKRFVPLETHLGEHDKRFVSLEARITDEAAATRRHFDIVAEGLRESFKGVIDQTVATGKKVDRLIASNAVEHRAFLDAITDHEVRITRLEAGADQGPKSHATSQET